MEMQENKTKQLRENRNIFDSLKLINKQIYTYGKLQTKKITHLEKTIFNLIKQLLKNDYNEIVKMHSQSLGNVMNLICEAYRVIQNITIKYRTIKERKLWEIVDTFEKQVQMHLSTKQPTSDDDKRIFNALELECYLFTFCLQIIDKKEVKILPIYTLQKDFHNSKYPYKVDYSEKEDDNQRSNSTSFTKTLFENRPLFECLTMNNLMQSNTSSRICISSFTGSGKTRCIPLELAIRALLEGMKIPFIIITQPGQTHVNEMYKFFIDITNGLCEVYSNIEEIKEKYSQIFLLMKRNSEEQNLFIPEVQKPIICILSPYNLLKLLSLLDFQEDIFKLTRFCFDEVHTRTVYLDILMSYCSKLLKYPKIPFHLILMSATIDDSVRKCISNMRSIELPLDEPLFPVIARSFQNTRTNRTTTFDLFQYVMDELLKGTVDLGHILVFDSGRARLTTLANMIKDNYPHNVENEIICLQSTLDKNETLDNYLLRLVDEYQIITKEIKEYETMRENEFLRNQNDQDPRKNSKYKSVKHIFVLPIVLTSAVTENQKTLSICKLPSELKNTIKVICATNIIESSITIENLAAVIDSQLYKQPIYMPLQEYTKLVEHSISIAQIKQRRGRVGRMRPGLYFYIEKYHQQSTNFPEILTTDISLYILQLRQIGIRLETILNLPDSPEPFIYMKAIQSLIGLGLLDYNTNITILGKKISKFPNMSPMFSYVIEYYWKFNAENLNAALFASIVVLIITSKNLIFDNNNQYIKMHFNEDSDLVTIFNLILFIMTERYQKPGEKVPLEHYGIITSEFNSFYARLYGLYKVYSGQDQGIFQAIQNLKSNLKNANIYQEINKILYCISCVNNRWLSFRTATFDKILIQSINYNSQEECYSVYNGRFTAKYIGLFQNDKKLQFTSYQRVGGINKYHEIACFLSVEENSNMKIMTGSLYHRYQNSNLIYNEIEFNCKNPLTKLLLNNISFDTIDTIDIIKETKNKLDNKSNNIIYRRNPNGAPFVMVSSKNKDMFQFINLMKDKIQYYFRYIANSFLIYSNRLNCAIEISYYNAEKYQCIIHKINNTNYSYFTIRKQSLISFFETIRNDKEIQDLFMEKNPPLRFALVYKTKIILIVENSKLLAIQKLHNFLEEYTLKKSKDFDKEFFNMSNKKHYFRNNFVLLAFPNEVVNMELYINHQRTRKIVNDWILSCLTKDFPKLCKGIDYIFTEENYLLISSHIEKNISDLLEKYTKEGTPKIFHDILALPNKFYPFSMRKHLKKLNEKLDISKHWQISESNQFLILPKGSEDEAKQIIEKYTKDDHESSKFAHGCIFICNNPDNPKTTQYQVPVIKQDGSIEDLPLCTDCIIDSLKYATAKFYTPYNHEFNMTFLTNNIQKIDIIPICPCDEKDEDWPKVPLATVLMTLLKSGNNTITNLTKAWIVGVVNQTLRSNASDFIFCPDHPEFIFSSGEKYQKCPKCYKEYCKYCMNWHRRSQKCPQYIEKFMNSIPRCPFCHMLTEKNGGCNHISCICGKHWCYKCGFGANTSGEIYKHMYYAHGSFV